MKYANKKYRKRNKKRTPRYKRPSTDCHAFKRCSEIANLSSTTGAFTFTYTLADLPAYTEFTGLYDQYAITGVKLTFLAAANTAQPGTNTIPRLYITDDYDGGGPTTVQNFMERGVKPKLLRNTHTHFSRPRVAKEVYASAISTSYSVGKSGTFLDIANTTVEHNGTYCLLENATTGWSCKVIATFYLKFKGVR